MATSSDYKIDKTAFSVVTLEEADDEKEYWLSKTPHERLQAIEMIRQTIYGYTIASARLPRVFEVAQQEQS